MNENLERHLRERQEIQREMNSPRNNRLKWTALAFIAVAIAIEVAQIIWAGILTPTITLLLRGCAGLFALAFAVLYAVVVYRSYARHIKTRSNKRYHDNE